MTKSEQHTGKNRSGGRHDGVSRGMMLSVHGLVDAIWMMLEMDQDPCGLRFAHVDEEDEQVGEGGARRRPMLLSCCSPVASPSNQTLLQVLTRSANNVADCRGEGHALACRSCPQRHIRGRGPRCSTDLARAVQARMVQEASTSCDIMACGEEWRRG